MDRARHEAQSTPAHIEDEADDLRDRLEKFGYEAIVPESGPALAATVSTAVRARQLPPEP